MAHQLALPAKPHQKTAALLAVRCLGGGETTQRHERSEFLAFPAATARGRFDTDAASGPERSAGESAAYVLAASAASPIADRAARAVLSTKVYASPALELNGNQNDRMSLFRDVILHPNRGVSPWPPHIGVRSAKRRSTMISFVIPAYNEEVCLPATLDALLAAAKQVGQPYEVIVVNDGSTDRTGMIAKQRGVRVVEVQHRQIAAARNAGARHAQGDILFFVDADTQANARAIHAALRAIQRGAAGGGCAFRYHGRVPGWARILLPLGHATGRLLKVVGGGFLFCRRSEFEAIGGFCERYFAAEDLAFVRSLKRRGFFAIPRETVLTSNRKVRTMSLRRALSLLFRAVVHGPESYLSREGLGLWYGPEARDTAADHARQTRAIV